MFGAVRRLPFFRILAIAQLALLARRHMQALTPDERRRMAELARRGRSLDATERRELRELAAKLEPRAFAGAIADAFSPVPLPGRVMRGLRRRR
jgi:hypothetical protein